MQWFQDALFFAIQQQTITMPDANSNTISKSRQLQLKLAAREAERLRIGQDLHDAFGGNLTGASLLLAKIASQFPQATPEQAETLTQLRELLSDSKRKLQQVIYDLRPPELSNGLIPALKQLCEKWQSYTSLQCTLVLSQDEETGNSEEIFNLAIKAEQALALYRIAQEGLNNVARHAQASTARLELQQADGCISLKITDNGKAGSKKQNAGAGLSGIQERATALSGSLHYEAFAAGGHCLTVHLPLQAI